MTNKCLSRTLIAAACAIASTAIIACGGDEKDAPIQATFSEIHFNAADLKKDANVEKNSPRPAGVALSKDKIFVALGNLTVDCFSPAGPGYVAIIDKDVSDQAAAKYRLVEMPASCRNPQNVVISPDGAKVYVSCSGQFGYGATPSESVIALDAETEAILFSTTVGCAPEDETCLPATPGKIAFLNDGSLIVGDAGDGKVFHLDATTGAPDLAFPTGHFICPKDPITQFQMTGDIAVLNEAVFVTCFNTSQLAFMSDEFSNISSDVFGSGAQLLALHGPDRLLLGDTRDNALYTLDISDGTPNLLPGGDRIGSAANQIIVQNDKAYVLSSTDNAIQIIDLTASRPTSGIENKRTLSQISTASAASPNATNTNPYLMALDDTDGSLFVTLMGTCTPDGDSAGNSLIRIDVGN